ncbi:hypothetical protein BCV70DRAFT_19720 [Testicularia cyperi]|uniref:Uncharacterized protein n=1 Tax=Testicularia cyperi TaxID=1882483 RepID=A0A317XZ55_9BASI|nr:hypothetical protein BCV70DRAFT_19720 [Testicularia cyperi]
MQAELIRNRSRPIQSALGQRDRHSAPSAAAAVHPPPSPVFKPPTSHSHSHSPGPVVLPLQRQLSKCDNFLPALPAICRRLFCCPVVHLARLCQRQTHSSVSWQMCFSPLSPVSVTPNTLPILRCSSTSRMCRIHGSLSGCNAAFGAVDGRQFFPAGETCHLSNQANSTAATAVSFPTLRVDP